MQTEENRRGGISVETSHIFPIIKKWLYSEKDIFLRELVSNACDAATKLRRLSSLGEYEAEGEAYRIDVSFSKSKKTVTVSDNGIGMTEEEVDKYLCKMALSGALDFIRKYEGKEGESSGIIGHFGLGFYSAFMVADTVDVFTRSYSGTDTLKWTCTEAGEYEFSEAEERAHGTDVVLHMNGEGEEYLSEYKLREVLNRYCAFMPVEIYLTDEDAAVLSDEKAESDENKTEEKKPINDIHPLWQKNASECTDAEYKDFYTKVFSDYREPLFHLHLNADYPLNFKGILFFPKLSENYESLEGKIKLYYNQVFVADNIKEVIPEYLLMLRGVLDCPELPLNVSRSYLQNNAYVSKVSAYIVKKVADKLCSMFSSQREKYEKMYEDIKTFIEYASICDRKFFDRVSSAILFTGDDGKKLTLKEYLEEMKDTCENTVYYATDAKIQSSYISMYRARGVKVLIFDSLLDTRFAESVEQYSSDEKIKFRRVDSDTDALKGEGDAEAEKAVEYFKAFSTDKNKLTVKAEALHDPQTPAILVISEESRRMEDMMRMYSKQNSPMFTEATLTLNTNCDIIKRLNEGGYGEDSDTVARQVYSLALLSNRKLEAEEMTTLLSDSYRLLRQL